MRLNNTRAILILLTLTFFYSTHSPAYVNVASKLDDLYRIAIRTPEFRGATQQSFTQLIKTGKLASIAPVIRSFPKEERLAIVLEIAEQRQMVATTQLPRLAAKYANLDKGDELLLQVIEHGDSRLFNVAPKYGNKLLVVERSAPGTGLEVIEYLGDEGWNVAGALSTPQFAQFAKQSKSIAGVEESAKARVLDAISKYPAQALKYLDDNPGILYKSAGVAGFLVFVDNISQPTTTRTTKPDGTIIETTKGLLGDLGASLGYVHWAVWISLLALCLWFAIQLWGSFRKKQASLSRSAQDRTP